jgi:hypothetical protein
MYFEKDGDLQKGGKVCLFKDFYLSLEDSLGERGAAGLAGGAILPHKNKTIKAAKTPQ